MFFSKSLKPTDKANHLKAALKKFYPDVKTGLEKAEEATSGYDAFDYSFEGLFNKVLVDYVTSNQSF